MKALAAALVSSLKNPITATSKLSTNTLAASKVSRVLVLGVVFFSSQDTIAPAVLLPSYSASVVLPPLKNLRVNFSSASSNL